MVGSIIDGAGAQANMIATAPILRMEGMISYRRKVRWSCQLGCTANRNPRGLARGFLGLTDSIVETRFPFPVSRPSYLLVVLSRHVRLVDAQAVDGATVMSPRAVMV